MSTGIDARDGAGALDAKQAVAITRARRGRNNRGDALGWDIGYFENGLFGRDQMSTFVYRITVPANRFQFFTRPRMKVGPRLGQHGHHIADSLREPGATDLVDPHASTTISWCSTPAEEARRI